MKRFHVHLRVDDLDASIAFYRCYARSVKHWVTDPQGIAWEQFHTLGNVPLFGEEPAPLVKAAAASAVTAASDKACCVGRPAAPALACC